MTVQTRDVEYRADGKSLLGWMALPEGAGARPAVLVAHEADGLGEHVMTTAQRLAGLGYVAFAMDYQGRQESHSEDELWPGCSIWATGRRRCAPSGAQHSTSW